MCSPLIGADGSPAALRVVCAAVATHLWRISSCDHAVHLPSNWPVAL